MLFYSTKILFSNVLKSKVNTHSDKFIRLSRSAKLAKISSNLKQFTFFSKSAKKDNKLNNNNIKKSSLNKKNNKQLCLLFLNQGLRSDDLTKLRWYLKFLGINITQVPSRFWSNSLISSKRTLKHKNSLHLQDYKINLKKLIHGNILLFHSSWPTCDWETYSDKNVGYNQENVKETTNSDTTWDTKQFFNLDEYENKNKNQIKSYINNDSLYYIYKLIQTNLIKNKYSFNYNKNELNLNSDMVLSTLNLSEQKEYFNLDNPTLPWELISSESNLIKKNLNTSSLDFSNKKMILDSWLKTKDKSINETLINLFLIHLKNHYLLYAGLLNVSTSDIFIKDNEENLLDKSKLNLIQNETNLFFDNIDTLRLKQNINNIDAKNPFVLYHRIAQNSLDPFYINCLNRKYLLFL